MGKPILSEYGLEISGLIFFFGLLLLILSIFSRWFYEDTPNYILPAVDWLNKTHNDIWGIFFGALLSIGGGWYFGDTLKKLTEFYRLANTKSKAKFIENLDRIEYLAWRLSSRQEKKLLVKKAEFKIK